MPSTRNYLNLVALLLVIVLALATANVPQALADPSTTPTPTAPPLTPAEEAQAAEEAASEACEGNHPERVCRPVVELMLKTGAAAEDACKELGAVSGPCVKLVNGVIGAARLALQARKLAIQAAKKGVESATELVKCVSGPKGYMECQRRMIYGWFADADAALWTAYLGALVKPSKVVDIIDLSNRQIDEGTPPDAFRKSYADVGMIVMSFLVVLVLLSLLAAVVRNDPHQIKRSAGGVLGFFLFWIAGVALAVMLVKVSDGLTQFLLRDGRGTIAFEQLGNWLAGITRPVTDQLADNGVATPSIASQDASASIFYGILVLLLIMVAILASMITLILREVSLVLMVLALPILLGLRAGPGSMSAAFPKAVKAFLAVVFAKPLMVLGLQMGASLLNGAPSNVWTGLMGGIIIMLTAFFPGVLYRLFGVFETAAGQGFARTGGGAAIAGAGSALGGAAVTNRLFQMNAPASSSRLGSAGRNAGRAAGAGRAGAGALGVVGAGLAVAGQAASAVSGAARHTASQVASGGNVLHEPESMNLPPPQAHVPRRAADPGPSRPPSNRSSGSANPQRRQPPPPKPPLPPPSKGTP